MNYELVEGEKYYLTCILRLFEALKPNLQTLPSLLNNPYFAFFFSFHWTSQPFQTTQPLHHTTTCFTQFVIYPFFFSFFFFGHFFI